jgi:hypothetical protein
MMNCYTRRPFDCPMAQQPPVGQSLLITEDPRSHTETPHSVGLLSASDRPDAETSTWQHTTLTTDRHPCPGGIQTHNPWKQASGRKITLLIIACVSSLLSCYGAGNIAPSVTTKGTNSTQTNSISRLNILLLLLLLLLFISNCNWVDTRWQ